MARFVPVDGGDPLEARPAQPQLPAGFAADRFEQSQLDQLTADFRHPVAALLTQTKRSRSSHPGEQPS